MATAQDVITVFGGCLSAQALTERISSLKLTNTEVGSWIVDQRIKRTDVEPSTVAWAGWSETQVGTMLTAKAEPDALNMCKRSYDWHASDLPGHKANWSHLTGEADKVSEAIAEAAKPKDRGEEVQISYDTRATNEMLSDLW